MMFEAQTEWIAPDNFPDLSGYNLIAIDLETKDPDLKSKGSGAVIGNGEIIGVAVAVDGWCKYYPFGHEGGGNLDKKKILEWLKSVCATEGTKVFHNAMYDVCWLRSYGIKVNGYIMDTMVMASLVDENRMRYTLNALSWEYLGERKSEATLREIAKNWGIDAKAELYKLPAIYVGEYAEKDAYLTLNLFKRLSTEIKKENLTEIFDLETQLFPCLVDMRFKGVRVDVERAHKLKQQLSTQEKTLLSQVKQETGIDVQIMAARSVAKVFDKLKLHYERTLKAKEPSFTKNFLAEHDHPVVKMIAKAREINKAHSTFIDSILRYEHKGRIHADINQTRSDQGGTVTGRFSYSNPNLQQIPARNKDLGPLIRSLFIPENDCQWGCFDYNQQEPRLVVHFAATTAGIKEDASVKEIVSNYSNSGIDFHETVADMAGINRIQAKTINLGLFYGMGKAKLQAELGLSTKQEAEELFDQYHERVPFVKELMNTTSRWASREGEIRTLLGRGCRFNKWEPAQFGMHVPMTWEDAMKKYGENRIRRAFTYKALNALIQGSSADMIKRAIILLDEAGYTPQLTVHDEVDLSIEGPEQAQEIKKIMEECMPEITIPILCNSEMGPNWGNVK